MTEEFPPTAQDPKAMEALVNAFASVIDGRSAVYVSSPLTSGWRAIEHLERRSPNVDSSDASQEDFRRRVIEPNRRDAAEYVRRLRRKLKHVVIDPTAAPDIAGWSQSDYRAWWGQVIRRYVEAVVLRDGWNYSSGCAYEFFVAHREGIRTLREELSPMTFEEGYELIGTAVLRTKHMGNTSLFLRRVYEALALPGSAAKL